MLFVVRQRKRTCKVVTCHEAGVFAFHLHRQFEELGIKNHVVHPRDRDGRGKEVKNDRLDAAALRQRLDRCERGNQKALSVVRIPTMVTSGSNADRRRSMKFSSPRSPRGWSPRRPSAAACAGKGGAKRLPPWAFSGGSSSLFRSPLKSIPGSGHRQPIRDSADPADHEKPYRCAPPSDDKSSPEHH